MSLYEHRERTGEFWKDYGVSLILAGVVIVHILITALMGYHWVWLPLYEARDPVASFWKWYAVESNLSLLAEPWGVLVGILIAQHLLPRAKEQA